MAAKLRKTAHEKQGKGLLSVVRQSYILFNKVGLYALLKA
jgi:hypothetical protein